MGLMGLRCGVIVLNYYKDSKLYDEYLKYHKCGLITNRIILNDL